MKTLLFIPTYNCAQQISRVLKKVSLHIESFSEIILIDNRSTDQTIASAQAAIKNHQLDKKTKILVNDVNISLGGSHKVAFNYALENDLDYVIVLHGDDQAHIKDFIKIKDYIDISGYDCLLGSRFMKGSSRTGYSTIRILGNIALNAFCSILTRRVIKDFGAGLNIYKTEIFKRSNYLNFPNDLTFNVFLLYEHFTDQLTYCYFPIQWVEEDQVSHAKVFKQAVKIISLTFKVFLNKDMIKQIKSYPLVSYTCRTIKNNMISPPDSFLYKNGHEKYSR